MSKQNLVSKAVRLALVCGVASGFASKAALAADATAAPGASTAPAASTAQLGKIEVTGSRIKRTETEQAQPVTTITQQQIKASGLTTIGQILQRLPSTGASLSTLDNFGGNFTFTGGGQSTIDLRNLGSNRVLVLVNGKRWVTGLDNTVDLNTIPVSIIDHIEVLQDGASAIYGSDAISGVVNIVTIKDYNGREASAYEGIYNGDGHYDGRTNAYDFTMGATNDKSGLVFNAAYSNQNGILSKNRNISKEPVVGAGNSAGSSALPNGRFVIIAPGTSTGSNPNNAVNPATGLTAAQCPTTNLGTSASPNYEPLCDMTLIAGTNGSKPSDFRPFISGGANSDRFNYAPFNYVLTPEERYSGYLQGYTDLSDSITFKSDMMYSHRDSYQQAAPEPLFFASSSISIDIPANQKYNPFGFDLNTNNDLGLLGRRMVENGVRSYHESEDTYRLEGGLTGYINMLGGEWDWDTNYAFSKDSELDTNAGHFNVENLRLALGDPAICAAVPGCVPLNLFGGAGSITPKMLGFVAYTAQNTFQNNQRVYNADITNNSLMDLPGGSLGLALGLQDLEHDGYFQPDSVAEQGYDSFNPGRPVAPTAGRTDEKSVYTEIDIPFLGNMPGIKLMDLDIAGRHTQYNTYGSNNTYRWGFKWEISDSLLLRASWSQGFRAPSIDDLFSGNTNLSANITDPCDLGGAVGTPARAICAAQGVSPSYTQPNAQINTLEGGNPHLRPETSVSRTIGFVYSPDWAPGFNLNADYYDIVVNNTINPISGQTIMDECYAVAPYTVSNPAACARIVRTHTGSVQTLSDQVTNVGTTKTSGIDLSASYAFPSTSLGDFKLELDDSHIRTYDLNGTELAGVERGGSVFPFGIPKDKIRTALDWNYGDFSASYALRYISHLTEVPTDNHIGAVTYHDVQGNYTMGVFTFSLGIRNLWAKEPPISTVQELNSFDPTLYDVPGRFLYGRISAKF